MSHRRPYYGHERTQPPGYSDYWNKDRYREPERDRSYSDHASTGRQYRTPKPPGPPRYRADTYVPSSDTYPSPAAEHHPITRNAPSTASSQTRLPPTKAPRRAAPPFEDPGFKDSTVTISDPSKTLNSPPQSSKWTPDHDSSSKWSVQKHMLSNGQFNDPDAISLFSKPAVHVSYEPGLLNPKTDAARLQEKGKVPIFTSYKQGEVPRTKDPRHRHINQISKRPHKTLYTSLRLATYSYDDNSVGPPPPTSAAIIGLGTKWKKDTSLIKSAKAQASVLSIMKGSQDPNTGLPLGILKVEFEGSVNQANKAVRCLVEAMNGKMLERKKLTVVALKDKEAINKIVKDEIYRRLSHKKKAEIMEKSIAPPTAPKRQLLMIKIRENRERGGPPPPPPKKPEPPNKEKLVVPYNIAKLLKNRSFVVVQSRDGALISQEEAKRSLGEYHWNQVVEEKSKVYLIFNSPKEAERCHNLAQGTMVNSKILKLTLRMHNEAIIEESAPETQIKDPVDQATFIITKELEAALIKDIKTKVVGPAVISFLNVENYPDLKEKLEEVKPAAPPAPPVSSVKTPEKKPKGIVDEVYSTQIAKLPSFKKRLDSKKEKERGNKKKRSRKADTAPLNFDMNFEDEKSDKEVIDPPTREDSVSTPKLEQSLEDLVEGPPKKRTRISEPLLFSSSEDEMDVDTSKESTPTTSVPPESLKEKIQVDIDVDMTEAENDNEDGELKLKEEDYSNLDNLFHPTATEAPIPVYEEVTNPVFDLRGIHSILRDEEDLELMKSLLQNHSSPIKGSLEYWAWKQREVAIAKESLSELEKVPENLESATGSHRSEGYLKIADEFKSEYLPHRRRVHDPLATIQTDMDDGQGEGAKHNDRGNRALNRRFANEVANFNTDNEALKLNQLNKRKKPVSFARSAIHNWGLYALGPIAEKEMIIEYVGEQLRQPVADVRERAYMKSGIGSSYLFRVDADTVIDATKKGGIARFINHCCQPSCTAKIIKVDGQKRIVIYALRDITANEELTYDYKFDRDENDDERVRCLCGAPGCKGYLN